MAADILLYDSHYVPVGEDQKQHVELTRDIAQSFNHHYGETFVVPDVLIPKAGARIMGLDEPTTKMSKSSDKQGHALRLLDPPDVLRKSIMRATTDSLNRIAFDREFLKESQSKNKRDALRSHSPPNRQERESSKSPQ